MVGAGLGWCYSFTCPVDTYGQDRHLMCNIVCLHCQLSRSFFQDITHPSSLLYHLFPPPRDTSVLSRLRMASQFAHPVSRTKNIAALLITP